MFRTASLILPFPCLAIVWKQGCLNEELKWTEETYRREFRARLVPLLCLPPLLALWKVKAATEATTTKPNLTSMTLFTHHSAGLNRHEGRDGELLLIQKMVKWSWSMYEWPSRLNSLHIFSPEMDWSSCLPARADEHTPQKHVAGCNCLLCVYPLAKTNSCTTQVPFMSLCPVVWYCLVADKIFICWWWKRASSWLVIWPGRDAQRKICGLETSE